MKAQAKVNIHNRFDIFLNDKQVGYAENIVLDQMYTRLCARSSYFVNIHFGTGTGTLSASRTSLFTHLGTKTAVNDAQSKALPTSWWRQKIVLNPEEYVGSALSEVGIAFGSTSTNLVTHALIRDMNGNVITLTKTALDVVTIYATVYVTFSTSNVNIGLVGMPTSNPLVNYLIGGSAWPSLFFYTGEDFANLSEKSNAIQSYTILGTSSALSWTSDAANKKMFSNTYRFGIDYSNGHVAEIGLGSSQTNGLFRLKLPAGGIYSGLSLEGVDIGTGDGSTTEYTIPSNNINSDSLTVYVDSIETSVSKTFPVDLNLRRAHINGIPGAQNQGIFKLTMNRTDDILAMTHNQSPYFSVCDLSGGTWIKRTNPSNIPQSSSYGCAISDDGLVVAIGGQSSPYLTTYDWVDNAWVKRANPTNLPTGWGRACSLSSNGSVLAVGYDSSPYIITYDWVDNAWVKRANPTNLPTGTVNSCSLSSNGNVLAIGHNSSPYITTYDWVDNAWVKRANPTGIPSAATSIHISADGNHMVAARDVNGVFFAYDWVDNAWVKKADPTSLLASIVTTAVISQDGNMVLAAGYQYPDIGYHVSTQKIKITFASPPANGAVITADYTVNGIHKTAQRVIDLYAEIVFGEVT